MGSVVIVVNVPHFDYGASLLLAGVFAGVQQFFGEDAVVSFDLPIVFRGVRPDPSYSTVRDYVRVRRAQVDVKAGRRIEVFVPQERPPGAEAEVDFGEVWVMLAGVKPNATCSPSGSRTR